MAKKNKHPEDTIDLPEVKDIPGQEHVRPPSMREMSDTTASSADEEGDDILEQSDDDLGIVMGTDADVTAGERDTLSHLESRRADRDEDSIAAEESQLDDTDEDGEILNETGGRYDLSGKDLDEPDLDERDSEDED